jgi:hypothetical protein
VQPRHEVHGWRADGLAVAERHDRRPNQVCAGWWRRSDKAGGDGPGQVGY